METPKTTISRFSFSVQCSKPLWLFFFFIGRWNKDILGYYGWTTTLISSSDWQPKLLHYRWPILFMFLFINQSGLVEKKRVKYFIGGGMHCDSGWSYRPASWLKSTWIYAFHCESNCSLLLQRLSGFFSWIEVIVPYMLTVIPQCFTNILTFLENCDLPPAVWLKVTYLVTTRAALTIGLGGAEAPGPEQGGGPWLAVE